MNSLLQAVVSYFDAHKDLAHCRATAEWLEGEQGQLYVRITTRCVEGVRRRCIDVATVSIGDQYQRKGVFTELLAEMERTAGHHGVPLFVENVLSNELVTFLTKRGYTIERILCPTDGVVCLYKMPPNRERP